MTIITEAIAIKVRDIVAQGLTKGLGVRTPGKMCVEAAVCYALDLPHGDDPGCVTAALRQVKIRLNDAAWTSDTARANGLRRLALAQLGSLNSLNEQEFSRRMVDMTIRKFLPFLLRNATKINTRFATDLEVAALRCEKEGNREACLAARNIARTTADAADAAAYAAAADAADAADAAAYAAAAYAAAAYAAAAAAADAAAYAAAYAAPKRDVMLATYAEWVVEILIDMQAPGCQWLYLVPLNVEGE